MPSITITFPHTADPVGTNFTALGTLSLSFRAEDPTARAGLGDPTVECWMEKGGTRYESTESNTSTSWQADFVGVPAGTGYTLNARLHVSGTAYDATPVTGMGVVITDIGGTDIPLAPGTGTLRTGYGPDPVGKPVSGPASGKGAAAAVAAPTSIHIHHMVSGAIPAQTFLNLRSISAAYFVGGVQLTRVFDAELNPLDGDYHLKMDLRKAASAGKAGSIVFRIEFWPNLIVSKSKGNLIVVED